MGSTLLVLACNEALVVKPGLDFLCALVGIVGCARQDCLDSATLESF